MNELPFVILKPKRVMDPYEPCWCQSGVKWKWCHKDRASQRPIHFNELMALKKAKSNKGYCMHPESGINKCSDRIISAHTIQKKRGLASIAENGHVLSVKHASEYLKKNQGDFILPQIGIGDASTYNCFCEFHDANMFKPVEVGVPALTKEKVFLLSFRALAYELFIKKATLEFIPFMRKADSGKSFEIQISIQQYFNAFIQGTNSGIADLTGWKSDYDNAYLNNNYDAYRFYALEFRDVLPVVSCGAFLPEFDFSGNSLQRLSPNAIYDHMTFNLTSINGKSIVVFGWNETKRGLSEKFVQSFKRLDDSQKASASISLAFEHIENTYICPSWWERLSNMQREHAITRFISGGAMFERQSDCLSNQSIKYVDSQVFSNFE